MYAAEANHQGLVAVQYGYDRSDDRSANINEREARIKDRIQRGMHDGSLTDREARRLYRELADIEGKARAFRSDGRLDGRETAELNRDLDRLASNLQDQRHDEQRRY
jgi:CRISPR/Cas system-associated endoribonuclease Cas2